MKEILRDNHNIKNTENIQVKTGEIFDILENKLENKSEKLVEIQRTKIPKKDVYLYEIDNEWTNIGHGEIRLWITDISLLKDKPFVGYTSTEEIFQNKWYGKKRILTMNTICKEIRWLPLYSDTLFSHDAARKIRKNLEKQWLAKKIIEKSWIERFYFL